MKERRPFRPGRMIMAVPLALCVVMLGACGGSGSGGGTPPSTPSGNPPPAQNYDTAEYQQSNAATFIKAIEAYKDGAVGQGVKIAVIDSGVDMQSVEFAGRIDPASRDVASTRSYDDEDGHGTSVSAVALAAKNDKDMHGIAFGSTLIALRTDTPGSCAQPDGCTHSDNNIAAAIDIAVAAGARVINMSLGGSGANFRLRNAIANATAAGVIVVISAGNDADINPDPLAQIANVSSVAHGRVLIAGGVDRNGQISVYADGKGSNRAGNSAQHYIATLGTSVISFDHTGQGYYYSGTSYAAPGVSGAVALLASAFPNLSTDQIIEILFNSAIDVGAPGIDTTFGRGLLDLTKAFSPQGALSIAGGTPISAEPGSVAVVGGALGDAAGLGAALGGVIILDGYDRAFAVDLASRIARAAPRPRLASALAANAHEVNDALGPGGYALSISAPTSRRPWVGLALTGLDAEVGADAHVTRGFATGKVGARAAFGVAAGYGADDLLSRMRGDARGHAFIVSGDTSRDDGMSLYGAKSAAVQQQLGNWTVGMAAGTGRAAALRPDIRQETPGVSLFTASLSRRFGPANVTLGYSHLDEAGTILGAEGSDALGARRAASDFFGFDTSLRLDGGWTFGAAARGGLTKLDLGSGLIDDAARLRSFGFSADIEKHGVFSRTDRLALRVSQPLRVEGGNVALNVPVGYDYASQATTWARRVTTLSPSGREIAVEAAWSLNLSLGRIDTNIFWRRDPGHIASLPDDIGTALRLTKRF